MPSPKKPSQSHEKGQGEAVLFVSRLERLIRMRHDYRDDLNPLGLRLLDRALWATYQDCIDFGAVKEANEVMAKHPVPGWDNDVRKAS